MAELLTTREVAALLRVDVKTVCRWVACGRLTAVRSPAGRHLFPAGHILELRRQRHIYATATWYRRGALT